ncbi:alpha/beta hydrolase [Streptomyces candidus]|uniref:Pimeloyl-ACP methyl ester carboxylesterase n=1 Tax=Streptomyces candidus TaxID=67283 RepID=A0A7X0HB14_9ACTN|nr:alpha/beta hydrolase [Streptomyces candidus]MBB6434361.1 pimeloyl-ACP methyl ester carboxylesterase [Streptomyces candidus]GHH36946.1 alpha/beta hydrolase [Streptomyces candidus]
MSPLHPAARRASAAGLALAACLSTSPSLASDAGTAAGPGFRASTGQASHAPTGNGSWSSLDRYYRQRPDWGSCARSTQDAAGRAMDGTGLQCAALSVPLDYADPGGRTITLAVSRLKATGTRHRIGAILLNIGGPGGPALQAPPVIRKAMKDVGPRYDIVGFDPRFVGRSTPLDCGWPVGTAWFSAGAGRAGFDRQVALQKNLAAKCRSAGTSVLPRVGTTLPASVLPHVTTRNTARDMDVIRGALGERKISYLGYSYGTYLGTVYTQMFPGRYDRVVLDGAFAPADYGPRMLKGSERENEKALADWAGWAAGRHNTYGLGRSRAAVLATVERVVAASAREPLQIGTGADAFRLDDTQVPALLYSATADDTDPARAAFSEQMSVLAGAAAGAAPVALSPEFAAALRYVLHGGGEPSGVQHAVLCGDVAAPRAPRTYWRDVERSRAAHPLLGPLTHNIGPCAFWDRPREEPTRVQRDAKALIVAATGDPRTTYRSSVALHDQLPGSALLTLKGANRHGLYGRYGSTCVDDEVNRYLATGELPRQDPTCVKAPRADS